MALRKVVVVFGATGAQGGPVARTLVKDIQYKVRGVTRNTASEKAQELTKLGIEMVKADLSDRESLKRALKGAYGVFLVTDFDSTQSEEGEVKKGISAVDVAKETGVKHLIYSGLEDAEAATGLPTPNFKSKVRIEEHIRKIGLFCTIVKYGTYYENYCHTPLAGPQKNPDGTFEIMYPVGDAPLYMICNTDAGECVRQIFNRPQEFKGEVIGFASDLKTTAELAEDLNRVFKEEGKRFTNTKRSTDDIRKNGDDLSQVVGAMFDFLKSGKFKRDIEKTRQLNPNIRTHEQWARDNKDALSKALDKL